MKISQVCCASFFGEDKNIFSLLLCLIHWWRFSTLIVNTLNLKLFKYNIFIELLNNFFCGPSGLIANVLYVYPVMIYINYRYLLSWNILYFNQSDFSTLHLKH